MAIVNAIGMDVVDGRLRYAVSAETVTGRLKSDPYYLLQLPKEGDLRKLIAAGGGSVIVAADIRCFELTVLAALAPLHEVLDELQGGRDAYAFLARHAMDVSTLPDDVRSRDVGKLLFLASAYGMSNAELAKKLRAIGVSYDKSAASTVIQTLHDALPSLGSFLSELRTNDRRVRSKLGRRPPAETLRSRSKRLNFPIQSTAVEVFNAWAVRVSREARSLNAHAILPLHDELVLEAPREALASLQAMLHAELRDAFRDVFDADVPAGVRVRVGPSFGEMTELD